MAHVTLGADRQTEPDDFKYDAARRAMDAIAANPDMEISEIEADFVPRTDTRRADLMDWLESDGARIGYCDRVLSRYRAGLTMIELLRQAPELREVLAFPSTAAQPRRARRRAER